MIATLSIVIMSFLYFQQIIILSLGFDIRYQNWILYVLARSKLNDFLS